MRKLIKPLLILLVGILIGGEIGSFISTHKFIWRSPLVIKPKVYKKESEKPMIIQKISPPSNSSLKTKHESRRRILPFKKFLTKRNAEVRKYVLKLLKEKYHYAGNRLIAMDNIFKKESGYDPTAVNRLGCKGLGQDCLNRMKCKLSYNEKDIECQVEWTIGYVKGRYGNPIIAWIKHLKVNWY